MKKNDFSFALLYQTLKLLEKILEPKFNVKGIEDLPKNPVLFVANHFTRIETLLIPYIIYKYAKRPVRCLADDSFFKGKLGKLINKFGAISNKNTNRDKIIISDLIQNKYDWMIYPEGAMIKSKEIYYQGRFISHTPSRIGFTRTGAAVLSLKTELYRRELFNAANFRSYKDLSSFKNEYGIEYNKSLQNVSLNIVPINITYYPVRSGRNIISSYSKRIFENIHPAILEELEIEGNIILNADIDISFGKAINISNYIKNSYNLVNKIPLIKNRVKSNLVIRYLKYRLTRKFMRKIYHSLSINIDHIFISCLVHHKRKTIGLEKLKKVIYLSSFLIRKKCKYNLNNGLDLKNLYKILIDHNHREFQDAYKVNEELKIIKSIGDNNLQINIANLKQKYHFHQIRIKNISQVIANEFSLLKDANKIINYVSNLNEKEIEEQISTYLIDQELSSFDKDYKKYFHKDESKNKQIGSPFFLKGNNNIGILMSHGFNSSPSEIKAMAEYFNKLGFNIYGIRLKGHGTHHSNMNDITYIDWCDSIQIGFAILRLICKKVFVIGFSAGGLLSLLMTSVLGNKIDAVIAINSALKLQDIRSLLVRGVNIWNKLLSNANLTKGKFEYLDYIPENPKFNYNKIYIHGLNELKILMKKCESRLKYVSVPTLILHSSNDPVVNPKSGEMIKKSISSKIKKLTFIDSKNHVIITENGKEKIFKEIEDFLKRIL